MIFSAVKNLGYSDGIFELSVSRDFRIFIIENTVSFKEIENGRDIY